MKKKVTFIILVCFFICVHVYKINKCKDINYCINNYFTSGIFNNYKLCTIQKKNVTFSNGTLSVVKIQGLQKKAPHKKTSYDVFLEKNNKGIWKVKNIYPIDN